MPRPCVDLPYAQPPLPLGRLSQARALVSEELSRDSNAQSVLHSAAELSRSQQHCIMEEMSNLRRGCDSSLKKSSQDPLLSTLTKSPVMVNLSNGSPASDVSDGGVRCAWISNLTMPEYSLKRPRYESNGYCPAASGSSTGALGLKDLDEKPSSRFCDDSSLMAADAVYFESLLGQLVGADLFLRFSDMEREGGVFLETMQRRQEELFGLRKYIEELNALRCVEQKDFAERMGNIQAQISKLRAKNAALEQILDSSVIKDTRQVIVHRSSCSILQSLDE
ncbi:unnamed protein product [Phytomonas sp. EM1]|nr:unnamed protein product [Phytomonas sp. EM1]|eukprot:CCW62757.1 unnamed protein product [Phytomonas sp. isolate EM1]